MSEQTTKIRGAAMVRETLREEHREMQSRAYARLRPYLAGALRRLRRAHPGFQTVVFNAEREKFSLVFGDGTRTHEAPRAFGGLVTACEELARLSEIEWLTAADTIWQVLQGTPQPALAVEQYRHVRDKDWQFWMRRPLREARYYMRQDIYSRTVYGSHRPGYGKRIVGEDGAVVDEWIDPVDPMILRVLRESGKPVSLEPLCREMDRIAGYRDGYYIWDVLRACERLMERGVLRRVNPRSSEHAARFSLAEPGSAS